MVDLAAVRADDSLRAEGPADLPREVGQRLDVLQGDGQAMLLDEEEPVAAPGDIAADDPQARHLDRDLLGMAVGGNIREGDGAIGVEGRRHGAHGGVEADFPGPIRPRWARVATSPMVPWPHIQRVSTLLKKMTPKRQEDRAEGRATPRPSRRSRAVR